MVKNKPTPTITSKKHLARLERERRQTIVIRFAAIGVILAIIMIIAYGYLDIKVLQLRQPIAKVGDEVITLREFQLRVRLERQRLINQYLQNNQLGQLFGYDTTSQNQQIEDRLNTPSMLGQSVIDSLIEEHLISQEAARRGIVGEPDEVEGALEAFFRYFPNGSPTPTITPTSITFSTLSPEQLALVTITPTATTTPTSTSEPTVTPDITATPLPIPSPTSTPAPTSTSTPYTLEGYHQTYDKNLELYKTLGANEADFRSLFKANIFRDKLYKIITTNVPATQEQVWARHILVANKDIAKSVRERLLMGQDFATLAMEFSQDTGTKDKGGDLGWFGKGMMVPEFEQTSFGLNIGQIGTPIKTSFGYHIIQVLGHENRPLTDSEYQQACETRFQEWLVEAQKQTDIKTYDNWLDKIPADPDLQKAIEVFFGQQPIQ
jgi:parvulin-like peptidyl-prolyl isomerase